MKRREIYEADAGALIDCGPVELEAVSGAAHPMRAL